MRQNKQTLGELIVKAIKFNPHKLYSAQNKIRIVLDGLRGDERIEGKPADKRTRSLPGLPSARDILKALRLLFDLIIQTLYPYTSSCERKYETLDQRAH